MTSNLADLTQFLTMSKQASKLICFLCNIGGVTSETLDSFNLYKTFLFYRMKVVILLHGFPIKGLALYILWQRCKETIGCQIKKNFLEI